MDNGILQVTLSNPGGIITGIKYNGIDNVLEVRNKETNRGYSSCLIFDDINCYCFLRMEKTYYFSSLSYMRSQVNR